MRPVKVNRIVKSKTVKCVNESLSIQELSIEVSPRNRISEVSDWVFQLKSDEKTGFPTQKPRELCKQIITLSTDVGGLVLDPFAGSGTIGKTSESLDRDSISFEADEKIFNKFLKEEVVGL